MTNPCQCLMTSYYLRLLGAGEHGDWSREAASNGRGQYIGHPYLPFLMKKLFYGTEYTKDDVLYYAKDRIKVRTRDDWYRYVFHYREEMKQSLYWVRKESHLAHVLHTQLALGLYMIETKYRHPNQWI